MKKYFTKKIYNTQLFNGLFSSEIKRHIRPLCLGTSLLLLLSLNSSNSVWAQTGTIGDRVWNDTDEDGIQDSGEPGLAGVKVDLETYIGPPSPTPAQLADPANWSTSSTTPATASMVTNVAGGYSFTGLVPGYYRVKFNLLGGGYTFTAANATYTPQPALSFAYDSDAGASGYSQPILLSAGLVNNTIDAGMFIPRSMPVKLTKFAVTKEGDNLAILTWTTTEELNSSYFEIQKSADATYWVDVAKVSAKGNHTSLANYQYIDNKPYGGTNYYRLKMVDIDATFTYSFIKAVTFEQSKNVEAVFYPNPTADQIFITNSSGYKITGATLVNLAGHVVLIEQPSQLAAGIDVKSLPEGIYIINISLENGNIERQKVLIKR